MSTLTLPSNAGAALSPTAERLLSCFRAGGLRWIVLQHATRLAEGLSAEELERAVDELESADLVERAPHGPLLYLR